MKCKLSDICVFRKGKVEVANLNTKNYISTENMLSNKSGITDASSLPTVSLTQEYKNGDVLVSNIRPYFKKIWHAQYDGGCSNDVLVFVAITKELAETLRKNKTIDWQRKETARAKMRTLIKRLLKKHKYPPEGMDDAVQTVMTQCELWTDNNDMSSMLMWQMESIFIRTLHTKCSKKCKHLLLREMNLS